jgi:sugar transferase (PEP-CTERM/EpsH1 system associated)
MRILFVCHRFPYPPVRGGKIRPFNMIRWLGARHQVTVASLARSPKELEEGGGITSYCHRYEGGLISPLRAWLQAMACLLSSKPSSLGYFYSPGLHRAVQEMLKSRQFDLIWVHCSSAAQYVQDYTGCYRIMDFGDMDSEKWYQYARNRSFPLSLVYLLEGYKLRRYEKRLGLAFNECTVIAPRERKTLDSYGLGTPVTVIPNGVDLDFFRNDQSDYDPNSLVFLGRMDYYPNIDGVRYFCHEILPLIQKEVPEVSFTIVGSNPVPRVQELAKLPSVEVTGEVPDVRPYVHRAAVSVVPLRVASGIQNKVLESMAMRVPVVASSLASEGIDAVAGEHLLVDDSPQGFAFKVLSVMQNKGLRQRLADGGRRRIEERHSWQACLQILDRVLAPLIEEEEQRKKALDRSPAPA